LSKTFCSELEINKIGTWNQFNKSVLVVIYRQTKSDVTRVHTTSFASLIKLSRRKFTINFYSIELSLVESALLAAPPRLGVDRAADLGSIR
jgi:hypothetical protein